jgi:succinate-acetate transporter protein
VVSILKGWYLCFWPVLTLALIVGSAMVASALTVFSQPYWG